MVLKIKNEFAGDYITEFICLKPKLYSILSTTKFILFEIKYISLNINLNSWLVNIWKLGGLVIKIAPIFSLFLSLFSECGKLNKKSDEGCATKSTVCRLCEYPAVRQQCTCRETRFVSDHHSLGTVTTNKICMSVFVIKRYILPEGIKPSLFGHFELGDCAIDEKNWSDNDVEVDYKNSGIFSDLQLTSIFVWDNSFVVPKSSPETNTQSSDTWQPPDLLVF